MRDWTLGATLRRNGLLIGFAMFMIIVALDAPAMLSTNNILSVLRQISIVGVIAIGVTFVMVTGRLDLSVGSGLTLMTVLVVEQHNALGPTGAVLVTLLAGAFVGAWNGLLIGYFRLNALIVTLAMMSLLQGLTLWYSGGANVNVQNAGESWFPFIGRGALFGVPVPIWILLAVAIVASILLGRTRFGRSVFAVGGNETASNFSGIDSRGIVFVAYVMSGVATALGAIIMGSRVLGAQSTIGQGYELTVLAGIIIGGTSLLGGSGSIWRTVLGVAMLGFLTNGLLLMGYAYYVQWLVTWVVIILAVWIDLAAKRGRILA